MIFIYTNPPDSGLGDRLLDMITIYAYAKFLKCSNIYIKWAFFDHFYEYRKCLRLDFFFKYIKMPHDIIFFENEIDIDTVINSNEYILFNDVLGATSLELFISKYITNDEDKILFTKFYFESFNKIKFKNIPENITCDFDINNIITIHLRRTDKISDNEYAHGVNNKELEYLNDITQKFIDLQIASNNKNICIISDDKSVKKQFINCNLSKCNIFVYDYDDDVLQVYVDFYCLSKSQAIFMSQKFSTFSIVSSLINFTPLYYCFNYGRLFNFNEINYNFYKYKNMKEFVLL